MDSNPPAALGGLGKASRASLGFGNERSGRMSQAAVVECIWPRASRKVKSATRMRLGGCSGVRGFWARVIRACTSDGDFLDMRVWTKTQHSNQSIIYQIIHNIDNLTSFIIKANFFLYFDWKCFTWKIKHQNFDLKKPKNWPRSQHFDL